MTIRAVSLSDLESPSSIIHPLQHGQITQPPITNFITEVEKYNRTHVLRDHLILQEHF